jgi:hypothetical protein
MSSTMVKPEIPCYRCGNPTVVLTVRGYCVRCKDWSPPKTEKPKVVVKSKPLLRRSRATAKHKSRLDGKTMCGKTTTVEQATNEWRRVTCNHCIATRTSRRSKYRKVKK